MMQVKMLVAETTLATVLGVIMAGAAVAQPMVTTRTVTTVTTTRNAPQGGPQDSYAGPREGEVVYDGQREGPRPLQEGELFYPETHVWQAAPHEFPRDWGRRPLRSSGVRRAATRTSVHAAQPVTQYRKASHPRRSYVQLDSRGRPVPVMVQTVAPDGYRDTVPAVIRPSAVPTVVRATGANPPPVYYETRTTEVGEPMPASGQQIDWAQERQQGMPQQGRWRYDQWDNNHWHDAPPPPPPGSDWDR